MLDYTVQKKGSIYVAFTFFLSANIKGQKKIFSQTYSNSEILSPVRLRLEHWTLCSVFLFGRCVIWKDLVYIKAVVLTHSILLLLLLGCFLSLPSFPCLLGKKTIFCKTWSNQTLLEKNWSKLKGKDCWNRLNFFSDQRKEEVWLNVVAAAVTLKKFF